MRSLRPALPIMILMLGAAAGQAGAAVGADGPARLLKDINPNATFEVGSIPRNFVALGGITIFVANTPATGSELFRTDGTEAGTFLVKDINPGAAYGAPDGLIVVDGVVFFTADDGIHGTELWRSDGTGAGTVMVKDIRPGPDRSITGLLAGVGGTVYFGADDGVHGNELWKSDGTEAGTVLVKDIWPGPTGAGAWVFAGIGKTLFFSANDGVHGQEPWRSDGTEAGTVLVKDIRPGSNGSVPGPNFGFAFDPEEMDGVLYFQAQDGSHGLELWRSDGTEAGTTLVKDAFPGTDGYTRELARVGATLFFSAEDGQHGAVLWKTDGTEAGTVVVKETSPGNLTAFRGALYFSTGDAAHGVELWRSDGTEAGTALVKDIRPGPGGSSPATSSRERFVVLGGAIYFMSDDGVHGLEPWRSDGTEAGTVLVKDIHPGVLASLDGSGGGPWFAPGVSGNTLFFSADEGTNGQELWKSDGTEAGTILVKDLNPTLGTGHSGPKPLAEIDGIVYFDASDGDHGWELWRTDGTAAGTSLVKDIYPGPTGSVPGSSREAVAVGHTLFFAANDGTHGIELWKSDGSEAGTVLVRDINQAGFFGYPDSSNPTSLTELNGALIFAADDGIHGFELWRSDGTEDGTVLVTDIDPDPYASTFGHFVRVGDVLVFPAMDAAHGLELWRTDGTEAGTRLLADILPGHGSSIGGTGYSHAQSGGTLYFPADDGVHGLELWKTDGTEAGTAMVLDINPGKARSLPGRVYGAALQGRLFFIADDGVHPSALWATDGTAAGTEMVKDVHQSSSFPGSHLAVVGSTLFFHAQDDAHGSELWKSDGTEAGTTLVKDIRPGPPGSIDVFTNPFIFTGTGGALYFTADDGVHGVELWRSDGTEEGTVLLRDIHPGSGTSEPRPPIEVEGRLLFRADDGEHGAEIWCTDGTEEGTTLVQDIAPGLAGSGPQFLLDGTFAGGRVLLSADDGIHGIEPWTGRAAILTNQPGRAIENLREELRQAHLPPGLEKVLSRALEGASTGAVGALEEFMRKVEILSPHLISEEKSESLLEFARQIIGLLE